MRCTRRRRRSGGRRARRGSERWTSRKARPSSSTTEAEGWAPAAAAARPTGGCRSVPRAGRAARTRSRCRGSRWRGGASASVGLLRSSGSASPRRSARSRRPTRRSESCRRVAAPPGRPARPPCPLALPSRLPRPFPTSLTPIPSLSQLELTHLLEANGKLRLKVEACEHNIAETSDAIEVPDASRTQRLARTEPHTAHPPPRASLCRTWSSRRRRCARRRRTRSR